MKKAEKKTILAVVVLLAMLAVAGAAVYAGLVFVRHEQRQNEDITNALVISKEARRQLGEEEPEPVYISLWEQSEKDIGRVFAENCSLNGFQKLACGQDVSMLIVGDSIGAQRWPSAVASWVEANYNVKCTLKNISLGGNYSFSGFVSLQQLQDDVPYDIVIVCYGQNDPDLEFAADYEALLRLALERYNNCSAISVLESSQRDYTAKMQAIQQIASYYSVPVADTIQAFCESGMSYESLSGDGVHPNEAGQDIYAQLIEQIIAGSVAEEASRRSALLFTALSDGEAVDFSQYDSSFTLPQPLSENVEEYSQFRYYPASAFTRLSSTEWQIRLENVSGKLGIDKGRCHEYNDFQVYLNDQEIYSEEDYQTLDYTLRRISRMTYSSLPLDGVLKIRFYSDECADAFYGLVITDYKEMK